MQRLEFSGAVRHIYIYIYIYMSLGVKGLHVICVVTRLQYGWSGVQLLEGASGFFKTHPGWLCGLGVEQ
jgi:hypothetical protein